MRNLLSIAHWEYVSRIRSKWFIISTLLFPLIMISSMFIPTLIEDIPDDEVKIISIIDETKYLGEKIKIELEDKINSKKGQPKYQVIIFKEGNLSKLKERASTLLDSSYISAYFVLNSHVLDSNIVNFYSKNIANYKDIGEIQNAIYTVLTSQRMINNNINPVQIENITRKIDFRIFEDNKGEQKEVDEILSFLLPIIFVMMLFFSIFMSSQILMRSVIGERSNRLVEILLSSVTPTELMTGKILGIGLVGFTQIVFYLIVLIATSIYQHIQIITGPEIIIFLLYFIFGYLLWASIFAAIGSIFDSEQEAQQAVSVLSIVCVIPIMISSYVISNPNSLTTIVLSFIPLLTPYLMILRIGSVMPPLWQIISTLILLMISVVLTLFIAGKIFRVAILLYGKRPTLPEILQWIREK